MLALEWCRGGALVDWIEGWNLCWWWSLCKLVRCSNWFFRLGFPSWGGQVRVVKMWCSNRGVQVGDLWISRFPFFGGVGLPTSSRWIHSRRWQRYQRYYRYISSSSTFRQWWGPTKTSLCYFIYLRYLQYHLGNRSWIFVSVTIDAVPKSPSE
jgi:hypothetical protein